MDVIPKIPIPHSGSKSYLNLESASTLVDGRYTDALLQNPGVLPVVSFQETGGAARLDKA